MSGGARGPPLHATAARRWHLKLCLQAAGLARYSTARGARRGGAGAVASSLNLRPLALSAQAQTASSISPPFHLIATRFMIRFPKGLDSHDFQGLFGYKVFLVISILMGEGLYMVLKVLYSCGWGGWRRGTPLGLIATREAETPLRLPRIPAWGCHDAQPPAGAHQARCVTRPARPRPQRARTRCAGRAPLAPSAACPNPSAASPAAAWGAPGSTPPPRAPACSATTHRLVRRGERGQAGPFSVVPAYLPRSTLAS